MATLREATEDCREFEPSHQDEADVYGVCPACGIDHGAGFCPEPGEHVVCACGLLHERDYCPTLAGHGVVL